MKKFLLFGIVLLATFSVSAFVPVGIKSDNLVQAQTVEQKKISKDFSPKNFIKLYKKTKNTDLGGTMIGKITNATKNKSLPIVKVKYTIKDKNHAMMYAQSDARAYIKTIASKLKQPSDEITPITIYFTYNFKNSDKLMFRIIIDKASFTALKSNGGDFTALNQEAYLVEPEFENI